MMSMTVGVRDHGAGVGVQILPPDARPLAPDSRLRHALPKDVSQIVALVNSYVPRGDMLPRSKEQVLATIRDWVVVEDAERGEIIACGALVVMGEDLAEVRSLAVKPQYQGRRLGQQIVAQLLDDARALGLPTVFALTRAVGFFEKMGFRVTAKENFPAKIWKDCLHCPKFPKCDETAVVITLT